MNEQTLTCHGCSQVFSTFLEEMAEHNQRVTCPTCNTSDEYAPCEFHDKTANQQP